MLPPLSSPRGIFSAGAPLPRRSQPAALRRQAERPGPASDRGGGGRPPVDFRSTAAPRSAPLSPAPLQPLAPESPRTRDPQAWDPGPRHRLRSAPGLLRAAPPPAPHCPEALQLRPEQPLATTTATPTPAAPPRALALGPHRANSGFPRLERSPPRLAESCFSQPASPPLLPPDAAPFQPLGIS